MKYSSISREDRHQKALARAKAQMAVWTIERNEHMEEGLTIKQALEKIQVGVKIEMKNFPQHAQSIRLAWNSYLRNTQLQ